MGGEKQANKQKMGSHASWNTWTLIGWVSSQGGKKEKWMKCLRISVKTQKCHFIGVAAVLRCNTTWE